MSTSSSGDIIPWPGATAQIPSELSEKIENVLAIFRAIDAGELLAALPECSIDRLQHGTALVLLRLAEKELIELQAFVS